MIFIDGWQRPRLNSDRHKRINSGQAAAGAAARGCGALVHCEPALAPFRGGPSGASMEAAALLWRQQYSGPRLACRPHIDDGLPDGAAPAADLAQGFSVHRQRWACWEGNFPQRCVGQQVPILRRLGFRTAGRSRRSDMDCERTWPTSDARFRGPWDPR